MQTQTKQITFNHTTSVDAFLDAFHFENALNNVIDNAIKYGGNHINMSLNKTSKGFEILVSDDGKTLTKAHKDVIFEKFYRIPKGNTHDVKGFGIGLYYTKKIIEKHKGTIDLELNDGLTTFKIFIPNEQA
jgi:two-component system phosphate regulon sensor histidine kinase PhoR